MRCRVCAKDVRGSLSLPAVEVQAQDKRAEGCAALIQDWMHESQTGCECKAQPTSRQL